MTLEQYKQNWYGSLSPTVWCVLYAHPLHRLCRVVLNYEKLPEPFQKMAGEMEHKGKTGDKIQADPGTCYTCEREIRNGGICDPI